MARVVDGLWFRVAVTTLAINAVLVPSLYFRVSQVVEEGQTENFVSQVRTYARLIADELEIEDVLDQPERLSFLLDSVILSGGGAFAEIIDNGTTFRSLLAPSNNVLYPGDDFSFGDGLDDTYYLSLPINRPGHEAVLRLGFDEATTMAQIAQTKQQMLAALAAYACLSTLLAIWFTGRLTRPVRSIQVTSRRIASGDLEQNLLVDTSISEIRDLAQDLESMRTHITGINARLRTEISERESAEASRALLEQRLQASQRLETVGTLAGGVAHEFNNLLTPILLLTENALDELPDDHLAREDLQRVVATALRARKLVRDVLTFSRGFGSERREPVRLADVVQEVVELMAPLLQSHRIELEMHLDDPDAMVSGDPDLLHHLVTNLVMNADHAMRDSGGTLSLLIAERDSIGATDLPDGRYVALEVLDTGHGMDAATAQRVFEPFFTTRSVGQGTGLGLSVVHGVVKSMAGVTRVWSEIGKGSKFTVMFPAVPQIPISDPVNLARPAPPVEGASA